MTQVREVMTPGVQSVRASESVVDAARLMRENDVGSLPVLGGSGAPVGIVTDRDIAMRVVAEGKNPSSTTVEEICSLKVVTVEPDQSLDDALRLMARHKVRRVPVVEGDRLVGVLAQADIALNEGARTTGQLVEEVSQPTSVPRE